jgi:HK97 family phage prohead protease
MEHKSFQFKLRGEPDDSGSFSGYASTYGNVDHGGDICMPGCFTQSIQMQGKGYPILWQHDARAPIGIGRITDDPKGLLLNGQLLLVDPTAEKAQQFMKAGIVKGLSIGFEAIKAAATPDGGRMLNEVRLWEVSIVTFPMNEQATVTSIKSLSDVSRLLKSMPAEELDASALQSLTQIDHELKRLRAHSPQQGVDEAILRDLKAFAGELQRLAA